MRLFPELDETITGVAVRLRAGQSTCVEILKTCLDRIDERDAEVRAWVVVDREGAMEQALALDDEMSRGRDRGQGGRGPGRLRGTQADGRAADGAMSARPGTRPPSRGKWRHRPRRP